MPMVYNDDGSTACGDGGAASGTVSRGRGGSLGRSPSDLVRLSAAAFPLIEEGETKGLCPILGAPLTVLSSRDWCRAAPVTGS